MLAACLTVLETSGEGIRHLTGKKRQELSQRFEELYEREQSGLLRYAGKRLADSTAAEDVVADAFLQLARVFPQYAHLDEEELHRLLVTIVRNQIYSWFRKAKREQDWLSGEPVFSDHTGSGAESGYLQQEALRRYEEKGGVEQYGIQQEMIVRLLELLRELTEESRQVFLMRHYAGLQQREIATLLKLPVKTVEQRLYRATRKLREEMKRDGYEAGDVTF